MNAWNSPQIIAKIFKSLYRFLNVCWAYSIDSSTDVTPPSFGNTCPSRPHLVFARVNDFSAVVNWMVPVARDNSGNHPKMLANFKHPPQRLMEGTHLIIYSATDTSGNKATCSFVINVTGKWFLLWKTNVCYVWVQLVPFVEFYKC